MKKFILYGIFTLFFSYFAYSKITKGPYLTKPTQNSMTILWESDLSGKAILKYGTTVKIPHSLVVEPVDSRDNLFLYSIEIKGLKPGKKYYYQVVMKDTTVNISYFKTAPGKNSPMNFVAIGDSRSHPDVYNAISKDINHLNPDLVISMGDLVPDGSVLDQWGPNYFQPAAGLINHIPMISTVGDHDTKRDRAKNFNYFFRYTKNNNKIWFSFDYGPAHFVSLDYRGYKDTAMINWFKKDMSQSKARWKFVYLHRPSYNLGGHRSHWGAGVWPDLYREYKADIVFTGHSHLYERFYPMKPSDQPDSWPVTYITTGGAGAELYNAVKNDYVAVSRSVNHFIFIHVTSDTLKLTTYLPDMSVLDHFEMVKNKKGQYDSNYLDMVKPQEFMDAYMAFANELLIKFHQKPTDTIPATGSFEFSSKDIHEDVSFNVILSDESAKHYYIEPVKGVLKKDETFRGTIKLYAKDSCKINHIYFVPPVKLNVSFQMEDGKSGLAIGRQCRYYPQ